MRTFDEMLDALEHCAKWVPDEADRMKKAIRSMKDDAVSAERERCVRIIEAHQVPVGNSAAGEMAAEWTMYALREIRDAIRRA